MSINFLKQVINFIQGDESKQEKKFKRAEYKDFQIKVKAFNEFINFEATRANGTKIRRNIYNLDIFADGGKSNPTFSCILFQKKLNIAYPCLFHLYPPPIVQGYQNYQHI